MRSGMRSSVRKNPEQQRAFERELLDLQNGISTLSVKLTEKHFNSFVLYIKLLNDFRGRIHLISQRDYTRIARRHLLPALMVGSYVRGTQVADIGSGAGLPGVPLAIVNNDLRILLFESVKKKIGFLMQVKETLGLENIDIIHGRAEEYDGTGFDTIVLRAVGAIKKNVKTTDKLLTAHGRVIFFKTHNV